MRGGKVTGVVVSEVEDGECSHACAACGKGGVRRERRRKRSVGVSVLELCVGACVYAAVCSRNVVCTYLVIGTCGASYSISRDVIHDIVLAIPACAVDLLDKKVCLHVSQFSPPSLSQLGL
jgi:hypothetical protein